MDQPSSAPSSSAPLPSTTTSTNNDEDADSKDHILHVSPGADTIAAPPGSKQQQKRTTTRNNNDNQPPPEKLADPLKLRYVALLLGITVLAIIFKFSSTNSRNTIFQSNNDFCNDNEACQDNMLVYRCSFALVLFFLSVIFGALIDPLYHYARGCYSYIQIVVLGLLLLIMFSIPNSDLFTGYAELSRVGSAFFLILQVLILIDLAYDLHEYLLDDKIEGEDGAQASAGWKLVYVCISLGCLILGLIGVVLLYVYMGDCDHQIAFISVTLLFGFLTVVLSITTFAKVGLLAPSLIFVYSVFVTWQALYSDPDEACNGVKTGTENDDVALALGLSVTVISLVYTTWSAGRGGLGFFGLSAADAVDGDKRILADREQRQEEENHVGMEQVVVQRDNRNSQAPLRPPPKRLGIIVFHSIMLLASMYMCMLLTNWGEITSETTSRDTNTEKSELAMWVKISTVWLTYLLNAWVLAAPRLCKHMEFEDGSQNQFRKSRNR